MKVVILCGGQGTRLREETEYKPKPMVEIGGKPILLHIMEIYAYYGFTEFILALGYQGLKVKDYFLNYQFMHSDFTVSLGDGKVTPHQNKDQPDWQITLADTGQSALKGARIARLSKYLNGEDFMVTYGDGIANINIDALLQFHEKANTTATFTGVRLPSRFGSVQTNKYGGIIKWEEKPLLDGYVNGGFFVFKNHFLDYLSKDDNCELETVPLEQLTKEGQLSLYPHDGFWHCMDTYRDYLLLNKMWESGNTPWKTE